MDARVAIFTGQVAHRFAHFTALPALEASTWFMSVRSAEVRQPAPLATATMLLASSSGGFKGSA